MKSISLHKPSGDLFSTSLNNIGVWIINTRSAWSCTLGIQVPNRKNEAFHNSSICFSVLRSCHVNQLLSMENIIPSFLQANDVWAVESLALTNALKCRTLVSWGCTTLSHAVFAITAETSLDQPFGLDSGMEKMQCHSLALAPVF